MNGLKRLSYKILTRLLFSGRFGSIELRKNLMVFLPDTPFTYIDVGAFDGAFYDIMASEKNISRALLVEPQDEYFKMLSNKYAGQSHVELVQCVLLAEDREVIFHENKLAATSSMLPASEELLGSEIDISGKKVTMQSRTLDQVAANYNDKIGLLKIDVQGAELEVLKGGRNILSRTEFAWIEVSFKELYHGSALYSDIVSFMESQGFMMINILPGFRSKSGELLQADCLFKKRTA